MINLPQ